MNGPPKRREPRAAALNATLGQQASSQYTAEEPEHRNQRRRFLVWALMLGATKPEVVVDRIVAEIEREAAP